jgi:indole-3-glycerol phosphate synthase
MGFLTDIAASVRAELAARPPDDVRLRAEAAAAPPARDLVAALRDAADRDGVAMIAEVKRASPSSGTIAADADPAAQATAYDAAEAAAISVLTEPTRFAGSLDDLRAVRAAVGRPVLRKDFLLEPAQIVESRAAGADAALLITSCLSDEELRSMIVVARELGMEPLVETHTDEEVDRALATDATLIGVNARNLETLEVDRAASLRRIARIPTDRIVVAESGVGSRADVEAAIEAGATAVLVGEVLMRASDPGAALRGLRGVTVPT